MQKSQLKTFIINYSQCLLRFCEQGLLKHSERITEGGLKTLFRNNAYRRFLKIDRTKAEIDQKAIKEEELYDDKYVLMTNNHELSRAEIALYYKELWRVERAFREMKSGLDLRPIYHWTDKRIRGHVMVCFLAFLLESSLRRKLEQSGIIVFGIQSQQ